MLDVDRARGTASVTIVVRDAEGRELRRIYVRGNVFLTCGVQLLWQYFTGAVSGSQIGICAGDGTASASSSQTCLQGTHQQCVAASSVQVSSNQLIVTAQFGADQGNFQWNEIAVADLAHSCAQCSYAPLDRMVSVIGVKQPGEVWEVQITLTIT